MREESGRYQIGEGKAGELAELAKDLKAEKIIFDNSLKPTQSYNLAKITGVEVIDRFQLILEIFVKRASTKEAQLQIQLANLRYQLPRARESVRLARRGEQPGFMGLGRYEIDVYYESIDRQITYIRRELKNIRGKRSLHRIRRRELGFALISLAGYTNAGKTSLFNTLAKESMPVNLGLFTTLSTSTRSVLFGGKKVLLTDTVGFIDRLPLVLVEAFHSTLEETVLSDVIIIVIDVHEPIEDVRRKLVCCLDTIREIGAGGIPIVTALNKIDLLTEEELKERLSILGKTIQNSVVVSALKGMNLEELKGKVSEFLEKYMAASFILPEGEEALALASELHDQVESVTTRYEGKEMIIEMAALPWLVSKIDAKVRKIGGRMLEYKADPSPQSSIISQSS